MAYTPVEIIALILIVFSAIKIIVLLINPSAWMKLAKKIWANPEMMRVVVLALAAIILFFLLSEMTIVQIVSVTAFVALLAMAGLSSEVHSLIKKYDAIIRRKTLWKEFWLYTILWLILLLWAAKEILI